MAVTVAAITKRLAITADAGFDLANKLYRVTQLLPSAVADYGIFADQILYHAENIEQIVKAMPALDVEDGGQLLKDIDELLKLSNEVYNEIKPALPARHMEGGPPELLLPLDTPSLIDQIQALQHAFTMVLTVCLGMVPEITDTIPVIGKPTPRFTLALIDKLKDLVRNLKCGQPRSSRSQRGPAYKRAEAHKAITVILESFLYASVTVSKEADEQHEQDGVKNEGLTTDAEQAKRMDFYGHNPHEDGMPADLVHHPNNVYAKLHTKDVDERSLKFHNLPFSKMKDSDKYWIVWMPIQGWQCDALFNHTKKLRANEAHAAIQPNDVIQALRKRWLNVEEKILCRGQDAIDSSMQELEEMLSELRGEDERGRNPFAPPLRDRSWSPVRITRDRIRPAPRLRYESLSRSRERTSKTEYWRSWGEQPTQLHQSLAMAGWKPAYIRGTDEGQTWFYGPDVVHIRRFTADYTPQDGSKPDANDEDQRPPSLKEYLIISTEWVEIEALQKHGYRFQYLSTGHYALDHRLTWGDIELLVSASATFREERFFLKYRTSPGGDLAGPCQLAWPHPQYVHPLSGEDERRLRSAMHEHTFGLARKRFEASVAKAAESAPLEKVDAQTGGLQSGLATPSVESQEEFIAVET